MKQAIEEESVRRRRFTDISDRMSILLMISGCLMIAVPITVVYDKKMKEKVGKLKRGKGMGPRRKP